MIKIKKNANRGVRFRFLLARHKRKNTTLLVFFLLFGLVRVDSHTLLYCTAMQMGCGYERKAMGACSCEPSEVRWCSQRIPKNIIKILTVCVKKLFLLLCYNQKTTIIGGFLSIYLKIRYLTSQSICAVSLDILAMLILKISFFEIFFNNRCYLAKSRGENDVYY